MGVKTLVEEVDAVLKIRSPIEKDVPHANASSSSLSNLSESKFFFSFFLLLLINNLLFLENMAIENM